MHNHCKFNYGKNGIMMVIIVSIVNVNWLHIKIKKIIWIIMGMFIATTCYDE